MGLTPGAWLELVLILAAVPVIIFGGAWTLRRLVGWRRSGHLDEVGDRGPAINKLTVAVEIGKGGSFTAQYHADDVAGHRRPPADPHPAATLAELRSAVDTAIVEWYRAKRVPGAMVVDYSIYPWVEGHMPEDLAERIGTDWLVFDVEEARTGFSATNQETGLATTAESLDALPPAVQVAIAARWPSLAREVPGMLTWQRTLTDQGFAPSR